MFIKSIYGSQIFSKFGLNGCSGGSNHYMDKSTWTATRLGLRLVNVYIFFPDKRNLAESKTAVLSNKEVQLFSGFPDSIKIRNLFSIISRPLALVSTNQRSVFCHVINLDHSAYRQTRSEVKD